MTSKQMEAPLMSNPGIKTIRPELQRLIASAVSRCTGCGRCVKECAFLRKHGTPGYIADGFDAADANCLSRPFECSLCGLCTALCPERLDMDGLFLEMRREAVDRGFAGFPEHRPLLNYERLGTSRRFTLYRLPHGCRSVFFPGCALSGTRPEGVNRIFDQLRKVDPALGIVFDCCMKPSHCLGREQYANAMFAEMNDWLVNQGVKEVLVACPNCQAMFDTLGKGLKVETVWEALAASGEPFEKVSATVAVHDPCVIRNALPVHRAVRAFLERRGATVEEMPHSGKFTLCCGKGGGVDMLNPELAATWGELRTREAAGRRTITYCAGCVQALWGKTPTSHLLDLLLEPEKTLAGRMGGAKAPFTYLNRLRLKAAFKRRDGFAVTRERTFVHEEGEKRIVHWRPLILLALLAATLAVNCSLASVRMTP